jgi:dipeptidase
MTARQAASNPSIATARARWIGRCPGWAVVGAVLLTASLWAAGTNGDGRNPQENCTVIGIGRLATADGSVITSQSDSSSECRLQVIPGRTFPKGDTAPVFWGMVHFGPGDERAGRPLGDYGKIIGRIPQAERTYSYFHTGYPQMNEHQLAIGESTCSQKQELAVNRVEGVTAQIMTVEQAQVFALQRCRTAREAVTLIGSLMAEYGFLPSCGGSEALCIADPKELWVQEIFSVGPDWKPSSGKPGAIWAARRVPDDHVTVIPNFVRIREIDLRSPDFMASPNYMQEAIDRGWYDPLGGRPFIWQEAYAPPIVEGSLNRLWLVYSTVAPSLKSWPARKLTGPAGPGTLSGQPIEGADFYPFSVRPERKLSVRDVIAFQRSTFEGTVYDMTSDPAWFVAGPDGGATKSPMASPFAPPELRRLLRIASHRTVAQQGYGMVAQLRAWLPDPVGGIYWFYVDNPFVSTHVPVYAGAEDVSACYKNYDIRTFSEDSARWAVDFVEKLLLLRWQDGIKDLQAARGPMEEGFFAEQKQVDEKATALLASDPSGARRYLTELTVARMDRVVAMYRSLRNLLIARYSGDAY